MDSEDAVHNRLERILCDGSIEPSNLPISLLKSITNNFADELKIDNGGFAVVYKGRLQNGAVAVKKLSQTYASDESRFKDGVDTLMRVKHKNIVRFLGYCDDTEKKMIKLDKGQYVIAEETQRLLCFEFLAKGSLAQYITDASWGLEWKIRYQIIKGICEGLHYLHMHNVPHLNLKPRNILLNDSMLPKIADFGISRRFDEDKSRTIISKLIGTLGYMAPESFHGINTFKSDIYSLGLIILEILTGQKGYVAVENVLESWNGRIKTSQGDIQLEQVRACAQIGLECIDPNPVNRPSTKGIIEMLDAIECTSGFTETDLTHLKDISVAPTSQPLQRITIVPKGPGETSTKIRYIGTSKLLDVHPLELHFPFEPNKCIMCPVTLTNRTEHCVVVWITPTDHPFPDYSRDSGPLQHLRYGYDDARTYSSRSRHPPDTWEDACSSVFQMMEPHSTCAVTMTMMNQEKRWGRRPPLGTGKFEVLMIVLRSKKYLKKLREFITDSRLIMDIDCLKRVEELGGEVHQAVLTADICDPASCQEVTVYHCGVAWLIGYHQGKKPVLKDVSCIDVHPSERRILVGHIGGYVSVWNYQTQERLMVLQVTNVYTNKRAYSSVILSAKFISREQWFAIGDNDGWVHIYAEPRADKIKEFEAHRGESVSLLAVHPTYPFLLTSSFTDPWIKLWDWDKYWMCIRIFHVPSTGVFRLTWNPRDTSATFAGVSLDKTVKVWEIHSSYPIITIEGMGSARYLYSDNHDHLMVTDGSHRETNVDNCACIWDLQSQKCIHRLGFNGWDIYDVACHPTLPLLATSHSSGRIVCFWDATTYRLEKMVQLPKGHFQGMVFNGSEDLTRLVARCQVGILIIEVNLPKESRCFIKFMDQAHSMEMPTTPSSPLPRISVVDEGPSTTEVMMNPSGRTMEARVSSSLGAMAPLLRKLDLLLAPNYPLRRSMKHAIKLLMEDLEDIIDALVEQSMMDSPNHKTKYWMHEARELSYDIEDAIDVMMLPHKAAHEKVRLVHGHRVGRLKVKGLPSLVKPLTRIARVSELRTLLWEATERHQRYELDDCISTPSFLSGHSSRIPVAREVAAGNLVGIETPRNELIAWLTDQAEQQLKIRCIVGPAGVGKTALAKELYRELGGQFDCRALIRLPRKPHMTGLLGEILSQIQRSKQNSDTCSVRNIIDKIRKHLQDKRYFIVIDGLWKAQEWDIIVSAFPKGHNCSRIMITCEEKDVATKLCSYHSVDVFQLKPLDSQDSEKIFFDRMSASNVQCHGRLKEVSCRLLRECAGLPLASIAIAGLLASQPDNSDLWHHLLQYFFSDLANLTLDEMLKGTVKLCYNSLPQDLKTCLLYLTMYPEGCTIRKVDLLKQWIAEGFIAPTAEGKQRVAENYFAELVNRGMIQPEKIIHNDEVLSCTVHHIVFDLIMHKSREVNFTTAVDYSQTVTEFFMKAYRLSLHFSCAQYATKLEGIRLSQIRSLSFYGLLRCMPSVMKLKLLRVLILEFWDDDDDCINLNLSRISGLFLLRYLKISGHMLVELPSKIQRLKFLETLEIDAKLWAVPDDIVHLPSLLHLKLQDEAKLPEGIGRIISLQTLQHFNVGNNSEGNVRSLCELINLRDLHITCSAALSDEHLRRKFVVLAASLSKLTNLRSLTLAPGAVGMTMLVDYSTAMLPPPMFLQRLELLPPICIFSRLPEWIGKLQKLRILKIMVRVLLSRDIDVLTGLHGLTVLSLYIRQPNTECVVFSSGALPVLKYFKYTCGALCLAFQEKALPNLERLKLRFNVRNDEMHNFMNSGIEHLLNLKEMTVKIGAADGAEESDKKAAESAIESSIRRHPRFPIYMNVRRVDWVEEELS